jgi:DNA invertase Pin-like site-specific DNA recombinase
MDGFVAYCRVFAGEQRKSGPSLELQRATVTDFVTGRGELLAEFIEVEGGRRNHRPALERALEFCQGRGATLAVASLDRLVRNPAFLTGLMESGVEFVVLDMPQIGRLSLPVLIAVAAREREATRQRTTAALNAARARGVRLGNPKAVEAAASGRAVLETRAAAARRAALPQAVALRAEGVSLRGVAAALNDRGLMTPRGGRWHAATVADLLRQAVDASSTAPDVVSLERA